MTKPCTGCGKTKDRSEFYPDKAKPDGLKYCCKECYKKINAEWIKDNPGRKTELNARWVKKNPKRRAELRVMGNRKYKAKHPERVKARMAVTNALREGRLIKEPCPCGETEVQGHHKSYEEDKWLDVEWMCRKCHRKLDKENEYDYEAERERVSV